MHFPPRLGTRGSLLMSTLATQLGAGGLTLPSRHRPITSSAHRTRATPRHGTRAHPLPHLDQRNTHRSGPIPPGAFCCTPIISTATRSATLMSTCTFPTHGYGSGLLEEISFPDIEGFSIFHVSIRTLSSLIPRR